MGSYIGTSLGYRARGAGARSGGSDATDQGLMVDGRDGVSVVSSHRCNVVGHDIYMLCTLISGMGYLRPNYSLGF